MSWIRIRQGDGARAGVCWRCDNRDCDGLTGWSVLRLLSQFVRLLCRRKARSAHTHFSIPVQSRFPAVPHLFLSLGLCFALTYLQFYALAGSQDLALKVEGAAVLGVVHVE